MERHGDEVHVSTTEASGGSTPHIVRYMLLFGLILAIGALSLVWITGAVNTPGDTGSYADTQRALNEGNAGPN